MRNTFGTYFLDTYKGNVFLILLVDGKNTEEMFQVFNFNATSVELAELDSGKSGMTITSIKN